MPYPHPPLQAQCLLNVSGDASFVVPDPSVQTAAPSSEAEMPTPPVDVQTLPFDGPLGRSETEEGTGSLATPKTCVSKNTVSKLKRTGLIPSKSTDKKNNATKT